MGRQLTDNVVLRHPQTGELAKFMAGQPVAEWAAPLIGGHLWVDVDDVEAAATPTPAPPAGGQDGQGADEDQGDEQSGDGDPVEPPRSGRGSGDKAWQAYAKAIGVTVDAEAKRDDIIAAIDAAREGDADTGTEQV